jgi:hypothetical protein
MTNKAKLIMKKLFNILWVQYWLEAMVVQMVREIYQVNLIAFLPQMQLGEKLLRRVLIRK